MPKDKDHPREADMYTSSRKLSGAIQLKYSHLIPLKDCLENSDCYAYYDLPFSHLNNFLDNADKEFPEAPYEVKSSRTGEYLRLRVPIQDKMQTLLSSIEIEGYISSLKDLVEA